MDDNLALREAAIRHCRVLSLRWGEAVPYEELKTARTRLDFGGKVILLPKEETLRPEREFLRKKLGLVA